MLLLSVSLMLFRMTFEILYIYFNDAAIIQNISGILEPLLKLFLITFLNYSMTGFSFQFLSYNVLLEYKTK